jgi:hypothetical protein
MQHINLTGKLIKLIKDNHLGIKLIPMISTWDQVDPIFPVRKCQIIKIVKKVEKYQEILPMNSIVWKMI